MCVKTSVCALYLLLISVGERVCAHDSSTVDCANGFAEKNTAGHDVSRGVKATVAQCVCVYASVVGYKCRFWGITM